MKRKIHAFIFMLAMAAGLFGFASSQPTTTTRAASSATDLLSALPASDVIVYVDAQRVLNDTLPTVFSNDPNALAKIKKELEEVRQEIGIDPYSIESAVMGFRSSARGGESFVAIVRGRFDANAAIDAGFAKAEKHRNVKRQEVVYEGRTIYLLKSINGASNNKSDKDDPESFKNETAALMLDPGTIVISDVKGVRATIDAAMGRNKVSDELVALATRQSSALMGFSGDIKAIGKTPFGVKEAEGFLNGVTQFYGAVWTSGGDAEGQLTLRTETSERARELSEALNGLKTLFSGGFASKGNDKDVIKELLRGINISATGNEVDIHGKASMSNINLIVKNF